ncbi:peptidase S1 [Roseicyclus marinus]|uniref:peptidase S1 n=1 Tax=Roseicyclus marinus TaxID=2161673 RepID=UPI00240F1EEA|nr:peptidase S1 [Roseicyclus marinus]MDG3040382.1 peptidase S1 [Roseicyclus marinus]
MKFLKMAASALVVAVMLAGVQTGAASAQACPSWNNSTVFGSTTLNAGFIPDPYVRNLTAGGRVSLSACTGGQYSGWVVTRPDFRLFYNGSSPTGRLTFALEARSNVDPVLLVNAPDGSWHFNDDYRNFNSAVVFTNPMAGQYDVWTGSYHQSSNNPAQLIITEYNY